MSIVVDFAWAKPSAAQLKQWGAVAAGMYTSHDSSKNASRTIVDSYAAAGIKSFLFFEDTANRALGGYAAGAADAKFAYGQAASYGKPKWAPIIPAADFDVPDYAPTSSSPMAKLGPVGKYFQAWHDYNVTQGVIADAAYGDYYLIKRLTAARLCQLAVQTIAWSGGQVDLADIVLYQNAQLLGSSTDVEIIENTALLSHLAWVPGQPSPAPLPLPAAPDPAPVQEDENMYFQLTADVPIVQFPCPAGTYKRAMMYRFTQGTEETECAVECYGHSYQGASKREEHDLMATHGQPASFVLPDDCNAVVIGLKAGSAAPVGVTLCTE